MKKIITLFQRNYDGDILVRDEVTLGAEWVIAGEGIATRKLDGTCCLVSNGKLFKRYEVLCKRTYAGNDPVGWTCVKAIPSGYVSAGPVDEVTGKQQGWVPVGDGPEDKWHREAWRYAQEICGEIGVDIEDGTFELLGPKIQGNPESEDRHILVYHGHTAIGDAPRTFAALKEWLAGQDIEGIVWHHPDGRMCKIKKKDFGLKRKPER